MPSAAVPGSTIDWEAERVLANVPGPQDDRATSFLTVELLIGAASASRSLFCSTWTFVVRAVVSEGMSEGVSEGVSVEEVLARPCSNS
jgi:hypothetical protein